MKSRKQHGDDRVSQINSSSDSSSTEEEKKKNDPKHITFGKVLVISIEILLIIFAVAAVSSQVYVYFFANPIIVLRTSPPILGDTSSSSGSFVATNDPDIPNTATLFTSEQLSQYKGRTPSEKIYLALLGKVYDVTPGAQHYGPLGSYHSFVGKDSSKAFLTGSGDSSTDLDDVTQIDLLETLALLNWIQFYEQHAEYKYVGKLIGRYYDQNGQSTEAGRQMISKLTDAEKLKKKKDKEEDKYPGCNVRWDMNEGNEVWCTEGSAGKGKERNWGGYPRALTHKNFAGEFVERCVCVEKEDEEKRNDKLRVYDGCAPNAQRCKTSGPDIEVANVQL